MTAPDIHSAAYRDGAFFRAGVWRQHGCRSDFADLQLNGTDSPDPVVTGGALRHAFTVKNNGPGAAPGVLFYEDVPTGTTVTSVVAGQGSCTPPAEANFGAVGCRLDALAVGASTTVTVKFKVTARAGAIVRNTTRETSVMVSGAVLTSEAREPTGAARQNHVVALETTVKAKPKPKPKPKKKKKKPRR